jgi:hypothetical protein
MKDKESNVEKASKVYTFKAVYQELHDDKQIIFPSKFRKDVPKSPEAFDDDSKKKSVSFQH